MSTNGELARAFFTALDKGVATDIENTYREYNEYIARMANINHHLDYDSKLTTKVGEVYYRWRGGERK